MALGPLTYKTPNQITTINADLTGSEGCGLTLTAQGTVEVANAATDLPYGIVVVGAQSYDQTTYPGAIGGGALEIVDALGCVVQVTAGAVAITVGTGLTVNSSGKFISAASLSVGEWYWGFALTAAPAAGQFLMRFQPFTKQA